MFSGDIYLASRCLLLCRDPKGIQMMHSDFKVFQVTYNCIWILLSLRFNEICSTLFLDSTKIIEYIWWTLMQTRLYKDFDPMGRYSVASMHYMQIHYIRGYEKSNLKSWIIGNLYTPPIAEIIWVKNVSTIVVCGFLMKSLKKYILKIWEKSWEPFGSYLLNSTANPAHFHSNWAGLAVLFSR